MRNWLAGVVLCALASTAFSAAKPKTQKEAEEPKPPKITIVEFGTGLEFKWTGVQQPDIEIPLTIVNGDKKKVEKISVHVTTFQGSGRTAEPSVNPSTDFALEIHEEKPVTVKVTLPVATTYRSQLRVDAGLATVFTGTIEIERKYAKAPLEIASVQGKVVMTLCPVDESFALKVGTTGDTVTLDPAELLSVSRKESSKSMVAVQPPGVALKADDKPLQISYDRKTVNVTLTGLRHPGLYEASVRLGGKGYEDTVVPLTVYVREPWWLALILITAGVFVSFFIRSYTSVLRPRLLNERRVATLFNELSEHATLAGDDAGALSMVQNVRRALTVRYNELSAAGQLAETNSFEVYDAKVALLPRWITLRKRVAELKPDTLREPFEERLLSAAQTLINGAASKADVDAGLADLDKMPVDIDAKLTEEIRGQLTAFRTDLEKDVRAGVQPILNALRDVNDALTHNRLPEAAAQLDALRRRYVRLLVDELSTRLSSAPPIGVAARDWPAILSALTAGLANARSAPTAAEAMEAFRAALALFLNTAMDGLRTHLRAALEDNPKPETFKPAQDLIAEVSAFIAADDLFAAWRKLAETEAVYREAILEAVGNLGADETGLDALKGMSAPAASAAETWDISSIFGFGRSSDKLQAPGSMKTIDASIRRSDRIFTFIILTVAVLTGLKTMWVDDLTWGGLLSYLAAFLWGVGFDQFSHVGLATLLKKA